MGDLPQAEKEALESVLRLGPEAAVEWARELENGLSQHITAKEERSIRLLISRVADSLKRQKDANQKPWQQWIENSLPAYPWTAQCLLKASTKILNDKAVNIADSLDKTMTPAEVRLEAHKILWSHAPGIAIARANRLFFSSEKARGNEQIRARYLQEVLPQKPSQYVLEFLLKCATHSAQDSWTRLIAVRQIVEHRHKEAAQTLATIYLSATEDMNLRMEALKGALALNKQLGHQFLIERVPNAETQPGLYEFFRLMRKQEGLSPLPPGPMSPKKSL